jgi:ATP-dependent DNA helicase RecG
LGRGIEKITGTCKAWGKPDPTIEFRHGCEFSVTFHSDVNIITGAKLNEVPKDTVKDTVRDTVKDTQSKLIELLAANPRMTAKAISAELGINERNVKKNIKALKEAGIIERAGSDRKGHWIVKSPE